MNISAARKTVISRDPGTADHIGILTLGRDGLNAIGRSEFGLRHRLHNHPLLRLEAIASLADSLPVQAVECHKGKQPLIVPGGCADITDRPSAIVRGIERNGNWVVLWNIEQIQAYRQLLDDILDPLAPMLPGDEGGMGRREAFLFLSAPGAVTPCHFDPENNFLLQVKGRKRVSVGRFVNRSAALKELDRYYDGGHHNLDTLPPLSSTFNLEAGDGVYLYPWAPHWVYNGDMASISLSITFRTRRSEREELAHRCNSRLRRFGFSPRPAGEHPLVDRVKASCVSGKDWLRRRGGRQYGAKDYLSGQERAR